MIIRTAIVEDDRAAADELESCLIRYKKEKNVDFSITRFSDAISFLEHYNPDYDVVFMDIAMPDLDGMTAAKRLRKKDKTVILIFVTNMVQYAVKGYAVDALDFIVKPVKYYGLAMKLDKVVMNLGRQADSDILVPVTGGFERVSANDVMYIEVLNHNVIYHTSDGKVYKRRGSLGEAENKLKHMCFIRCNSCYLVNPKFVKGLKNYTVNVGGEELIISHPRKKQFMEALADYFGMK